MKLALRRPWRCPSRGTALVSNPAGSSRAAYPQTSFSYFSTSRPDPPSKEILCRVYTSPRVRSQSGLLLIERYRYALVSNTSRPHDSRPFLAPRSVPLARAGFPPSMSQQRSSSTSTSKGNDARNTNNTAQSTGCNHSHPNHSPHSHSIFHSHSHDDHDHAGGAEQIVHIFEGKGVLSFAWCNVLAQHA